MSGLVRLRLPGLPVSLSETCLTGWVVTSQADPRRTGVSYKIVMKVNAKTNF